MSITSNRARRVFVLEVAGLPQRYHSGGFNVTGSNLSSVLAVGIGYQDIEAIVSVGSYSAELDPSGGVATYNSVTVTLNSDRLRGDLNDPSVIFGRCGARASGPFRAQVTSELQYETDIGTLDIDTTVSGVSYPALFHIGAETIKVTGATPIAGGDRLSFNERAVGGSQRQAHLITQGATNVPEVATAITTFRGRRASLWLALQYPDGGVGDFTEVVNGFINSAPTVEEGGTVTLSLTPIIGLVDGQITDRGRKATHLKQGFHYYTGREGSYLEWAVALKNGGVTYWVYRPTIDPVGPPPTFEIHTPQEDDHNLFWFAGPRGVDPDTDGAHPRYPRLEGPFQNSSEHIFYPLTESGGSYTFDATQSVYSTSGPDYIATRTNSEAESKRIKLGTNEVKPWPDVAIEGLINEPDSVTGYDGSWARWQLSADGTVVITPTRDPHGVNPRVILSHRGLSQLVVEGEELRARYWDANGPRPPLWSRFRVWYPIDIREPDSQELFSQDPRPGQPRHINQRVLECVQSQTKRSRSFQIRSVALAYYQWRELTLLVEDSLGLPTTATAGTTYDIQVKYVDRRSEEVAYQWLKATHQTTATYDSSTVGYVIHLDPAQDWELVSSFGDWADSERAEIYGGALFDRERPGEVILKLLQSGGGGAKLGTYDVYSIGLAIPSSDIDEDSFLTYDGSSAFTFSGSISGDGVKVSDVIDSMLKAMSCALIMKRTESGRSLITLQPIGAERSASATATISAGDWHSDQPPTWSIYEDVVTQTVVRYDWDTQEERWGAEVTFNNQEAINRYGGERAQVSLDLYGLTSRDIGDALGDTLGYFLPVVARQWNLLSNPLRMWRGSIGTGQSLLMDVGAYVSVSSPLLKGYGDSWGVTDQVGMVQSISQELMGEGAQIEIITTGTAPVAWNASADVSAINSATDLTVLTDSYSGPAVDDVSFFQVGDVVDYLPRGNHDAAITGLEIASITGNRIRFTAAHGVTVTGGTLEPTIYTSASAHNKADAYLASNTSPPVLGSSVDAQRYS